MRSSASLALLLAACSGGSGYAPAGGRPSIAPEPRALPPVYRPPASVPPAVDTAPPPLDAEYPPEAGGTDGPRGTAGSGSERYDSVGYASWYGEELSGAATASGEPFVPSAITAAHRTLPLGSVAEVTSLDTGRTIIVRITDRGPGRRDREIDLSRGAADAIGANGVVIPVRVRAVSASPADLNALLAGRAASPRLDAPAALLVALRRKLGAPPLASKPSRPMPRIPAPPVPAPPRPQARPSPSPRPATETGRYLVQIAAFSSEDRARALARALGGDVQSVGALWRVRLGPFADRAAAQRARDGAARRGYGDAQILTDP